MAEGSGAPYRDDVFRRDAGCERGTFGLLDTRPPVRVGKAVGPKAHVLVCAPSNSALDEIVSRLLQFGLLDWCRADLIADIPTVIVLLGASHLNAPGMQPHFTTLLPAVPSIMQGLNVCLIWQAGQSVHTQHRTGGLVRAPLRAGGFAGCSCRHAHAQRQGKLLHTL